MALIHDAYLFEQGQFAATALAHLTPVPPDGEAYTRLRSEALELFDRNQQVRDLADRYGGWTRDAIVADIPADRPQAPEDTAFWLVLMLYSQLGDAGGKTLGLGDEWRLMDSLVEQLSWNRIERRLLIYGRPFRELVEIHVQSAGMAPLPAAALEVLDNIRPFSTGGSAGWVGSAESQTIHAMLLRDQPQLTSLRVAEALGQDDRHVQQVYQSAIDMFAVTEDGRRGLCLIISG